MVDYGEAGLFLFNQKYIIMSITCDVHSAIAHQPFLSEKVNDLHRSFANNSDGIIPSETCNELLSRVKITMT